MAGTGHRFEDGLKRGRFNRDIVWLGLVERAEDLFRDLLGEPERILATNWRPKSNMSLSFAIKGNKRGHWKDFATGEGGDILDLVAVYLCGLSNAADDFPAVLEAAARWAGIAAEEVDRAEIDRRRSQRDRAAAAETAREAARKAATLADIIARVQPLEGTSAATYLASRGITSWPEGALAYLPGDPAALVVWAKDDAGKIVGGQRIFVTQAGARTVGHDGAKRPKTSFGSIQGFPARLCGSGNRLYVAEGPETALSVWAATGADVWAVFGWAGFKTAPLPLDRPVIFCPDRDPPGPAVDGFRACITHHLVLGADVWVAVAPEPDGSKSDLNDTHHRAGLEAVKEALEAGIRAAKASPEVPREPTSGPPLRPVEGLGDVLEVREARRLLQAEVRDGLRRPGVTLLEATLGLGKTHAMIAEVAKLLVEAKDAGIEKPAVVITAPMHRLGRQMKVDIEAEAPTLRVVQLYGPEAQDPDVSSQSVCKRLDEYKERQALLLDMQKFCEVCPFVGSCLHITSKNQEAQIYVASHERLKASRTPLKKGQTLVATVIDESPMSALVNTSRRAMPLAALSVAPTRIRTKQGKQIKRLEAEADLRAFRSRLEATIKDHGVGYLRLSDLSGWTVEDAEAAAALEWRRKVDDETDPEVRGNKTITVLAGIYAEIARSIAGQIEVNGRLHIRNGEMGLEFLLSRLKPVSEALRKAPVLLLDATAQVQAVQLLVGEPLAHHATIRARENIVIEQDPDWSGAKSKFFDRGKANGNIARVRRFIELQAMTSKTVVIGNKDTIAELHLPDYIKTAHFNALRGLNDFANAETLVIIGRLMPTVGSLERIAGALWGTPCVGSLTPEGKVWRRVLHEGKIMEAETTTATHDDPRADLLLGMIRDAEVAQAVGRLRAVNRTEPVRCILLSDAVVDYPVRLISLKPTLWACGIIGDMLERGVAFLSPSHAAVAYPDLYTSQQAAAKVLDRLADITTFSIEYLYGKGCDVVTLKRPRSHHVGTAIIRPDLVDVEAAIKAVLPNAEVLRIKRPQAEPPVAETDSRLPAAPVLDLGEARLARADQVVEAEFQKASNRAQQVQKAKFKTPEGPPVRKIVSDRLVTCPARRLVWALADQPKALPRVLRRYSVEGKVFALSETSHIAAPCDRWRSGCRPGCENEYRKR